MFRVLNHYKFDSCGKQWELQEHNSLLRLAVGRARSTESPFLQSTFFFRCRHGLRHKSKGLTSSMKRSLFWSTTPSFLIVLWTPFPQLLLQPAMVSTNTQKAVDLARKRAITESQNLTLCHKDAQLTPWSSTQKVRDSNSSLPEETQAHSFSNKLLGAKKKKHCLLSYKLRQIYSMSSRQSLTEEEHSTLTEEANLDYSPSFLPLSLLQFISILYIA